MSIALLVITDGRRECIEQTIPSALDNLAGWITSRVIWDDSGDPAYRFWLIERFSKYGFSVAGGAGRSGFGGAIQGAWDWLRANTFEPYIFHLEDDFTFNRRVDVGAMQHVLDTNGHLAQLALRRQPWNDHEREAGGIVEQHPDEYIDRSDEQGHHWLEHTLFFTTNPCLYRRSLIDEHWPIGGQSEGRFTHQLLVDGFDTTPGRDARFGFWGSRYSGEWVTHIGHQRAGKGY